MLEHSDAAVQGNQAIIKDMCGVGGTRRGETRWEQEGVWEEDRGVVNSW